MAIGRSIASLFVRMGLDSSDFKRGSAGARSEVAGLRSELSAGAGAAGGLQSALGLLGSAGLLYAAKEAAGMAWELGKAGAASLQVEGALRDLTQGAGASMDDLVRAVREASGNTVSEFDTMLALNRGILLKMGTDVQGWADLMEVARFRARAMGVETTQALNDITTGIGRESKMILDNLGIIIDTDQVLKDYAATHGKAVADLDAFERKEAIKTAVIAEGKQQIAAAGGITDDYADKIAQAEAAAADAAMAFKEALAPAVAAVGEKLAEWIPALVTTTDQLSILAEAGIAWAAAALAGRDATAEFNAAVAEGIGAEQEAARIRYEAAQQVVDGLRAERDELLAARAAGVQVYQSHIDMANAELATAEAARDVARAWYQGGYAAEEIAARYEEAREGLVGITQESGAAAAATATFAAGFSSTAPAILGYVENLYAVSEAIRQVKQEAATVSVEDIGTGFAAGMSRVESQLLSVAGVADTARLNTIYGEYQAQLEELYSNTTGMTDFELSLREEVILGHLQAEVAGFRTTATEEKRILSQMSDTYSEMRSVVESALRPTSVTAEDLGLAAIGEYVEKWDENARRLDAVAARGFAELEAHPDWAEILQIPPEVLAAGEDALRGWASRTADAVRGLARPDLLNIDAAVQAVQDELNRQAAVELSLDLVTKAALEKGLVTGEDAKSQVAQALGLEQAVPVKLGISDEEKEAFVAGLGTIPVPVQFTTGETEGMETTGLQEMMGQAVEGLEEGWAESLAEIPWMQQLSVVWMADIKASEGRLKEVGAAIGAPLWDGLLGRLRGSGIVNHIVAEVLEALVSETS